MNKFVRSAASVFIAAYLVSCSAGSTDAEHLAKAEQFLGSGKTKAALIELKNALKKNKDNARARFLLGQLNLQQGDPAAAEKELTIALKLGVPAESVMPLLAEALLYQGKFDAVAELDPAGLSSEARARTLAAQGVARLSQGKKEDAEKLINQALEEYPASSQAQTAKARLLAATGHPEEALQLLEKTLSKNPEFADAWSLMGTIEQNRHNYEKAVRAFTKAIDARENNLADRLSRAMNLIQLKRYDEAQQDVDKLKRLLPQHTGVNFAQGMIYLGQQKLEDAQNAFEQAIVSKKVNPLAYYFLGAINFVKGNQGQAETYTERFLARVPGNVMARKQAARIKLQLKKPQDVVELLEPVVEQFDKDVEAMDLLASALLEMGKTDRAIELLDKIVTLEPESSQAQLRLGAGLFMEGKEERAARYLQNAVKLDPKNVQADILLVLNYLKQNNFDKAIKAAEAFRDKHPDDPAAYNLLGRVQLAAGNENAAIAAFEQAAKIKPGDPFALSNLAQIAIGKKEFDKARRYYRRVLDEHENHLGTLVRLSMLDAIENKEKAMVEHLQQAVEAHPDAVQPRLILARYYLGRNKPEQAAALIATLDEKQRRSAPVLQVQGAIFLQQKAYGKARPVLEDLVAAAPKSAEAHFLLAQAYEGLKKLDKADSELEQALRLNPDFTRARIARARLMLQQKRVEAAREEFKKLEASAPDNPDVMKLEAALANNDGDKARAIAIYEKLLEKVPNTQNLLNLAVMKWQAGDKAGAAALQEEWVKSHPRDKVAWLSLANTYLLQQQIDKVIGAYERVLRLDPDNIVALNNLAWYMRDRDIDRALGYAERAYELTPKSASILDTYALTLLAKGDNAKALRMVERALDQEPANLSIQVHYARIAAANGERDAAIQTLKTVLSKGKDFPEKEEAERLLRQLEGS